MRNPLKLLIPNADLDSAFTFYYDETNNIRKFSVREKGFNSPLFESNFVIGGVVIDESKPDIGKLFSGLNLESSIKEVKLKHLAKGDFLSCLNSHKLNCFLRYLLENSFYIHYSNINLLYFSLADIVDSALLNSKTGTQLGLGFPHLLKNCLYKIAKLEIDSVIDLFYKFEYPNIKKCSVIPFIDALTELFEDYEDKPEFHLGLTSLKQILKKSKNKKSLPFIMDEEDYILMENFSGFYLRPLYTFKNSTHIFDKEDSIEDILNKFVIKDGDKVLQSYYFENSKDNLYIQASDIFIGLVGKLSTFINTNSPADIKNSIQNLSTFQSETLNVYFDLVKKAESKNFAFLHSIDSFEEASKLKLIYEMRKK
ncbi:MAG: hypothetical protein KME29_31305 [Calothrix sp. FI2-JRJ7]|nr:hypothetical protein [Calothrix sp. FI2-JRJ7]